MSLTCDCAYQTSACVWTQPFPNVCLLTCFGQMMKKNAMAKVILWAGHTYDGVHNRSVAHLCIAMPVAAKVAHTRDEQTAAKDQVYFLCRFRCECSCISRVSGLAYVVFTHTHQCTMSVIHNVMEWVQYIHHVRTPVQVLYAYTLGRNRSSTHTYKQTNHLFVVIKRKGKNINRVKRR